MSYKQQRLKQYISKKKVDGFHYCHWYVDALFKKGVFKKKWDAMSNGLPVKKKKIKKKNWKCKAIKTLHMSNRKIILTKLK